MIRLSLPAMGGMVLYSLFSLTDTFFVARLGAQALAALTLCIPIEVLLISVGTATGVGVTSLISRTLGEKDFRMADNIAWHALFIGVIYACIFSYVGLHVLDFLLRSFGCTEEIYILSQSYLHVLLQGSLFIFVPIMAGSIVQGEGNTVLPTLTALAGIFINVCLDPVFIFGFGPIEGRGLEGAAIATILSQAAASVFMLALMIKRPILLTWSLRNFWPRLRVLSGIYKVGFPTLIVEIILVMVMVVINRTLAGFSYTAVAALGVFARIRSLFYLPVSGISQGVMPIAGFAYGAGNKDRVKEVIIKASVFSFALLLCGWILMQFRSAWIMQFFSTDPDLTLMGITCMQLATIVLPIMGPIIILHTVLQAAGKGVAAMWLSIIRTVGFFLPSILILPRIFGLNGVWLAYSVSEALSALVSLVFFLLLWKDLQEKKQYTIMLMLKRGAFWKGIKRWLRW